MEKENLCLGCFSLPAVSAHLQALMQPTPATAYHSVSQSLSYLLSVEPPVSTPAITSGRLHIRT